MLALFVTYFTNKKKQKDQPETEENEETLKRKGALRILSIIPLLVAVLLFILTENMSNPMIWVDRWTIWMALITLVQIVLAVFAKKSNKENNTPNSEQAA